MNAIQWGIVIFLVLLSKSLYHHYNAYRELSLIKKQKELESLRTKIRDEQFNLILKLVDEKMEVALNQSWIQYALKYSHCKRGPRGPMGFPGRPGKFKSNKLNSTQIIQYATWKKQVPWRPFGNPETTANILVRDLVVRLYNEATMANLTLEDSSLPVGKLGAEGEDGLNEDDVLIEEIVRYLDLKIFKIQWNPEYMQQYLKKYRYQPRVECPLNLTGFRGLQGIMGPPAQFPHKRWDEIKKLLN